MNIEGDGDFGNALILLSMALLPWGMAAYINVNAHRWVLLAESKTPLGLLKLGGVAVWELNGFVLTWRHPIGRGGRGKRAFLMFVFVVPAYIVVLLSVQ